ncbi:MAG: hypothetical protein ACKVWR_03340 [Acidimicrobiales bacterium]
MKRWTAIRHLVEMAAEATDMLRWRGTDIGWPLEELWVTGELLDTDGDVEMGAVILLLDVAPEELPWLATHPAGEFVGDRLRLGKRPVAWFCRPSVWPPWNARHRRVARLWSAATGVDQATIEALRSGTNPGVAEPGDDDLREQLGEERRALHARLRQTVHDYWDPAWRRRDRGHEAEEHLWRTAAGLVDIDDALAALGPTPAG